MGSLKHVANTSPVIKVLVDHLLYGLFLGVHSTRHNFLLKTRPSFGQAL